MDGASGNDGGARPADEDVQGTGVNDVQEAAGEDSREAAEKGVRDAAVNDVQGTADNDVQEAVGKGVRGPAVNDVQGAAGENAREAAEEGAPGTAGEDAQGAAGQERARERASLGGRLLRELGDDERGILQLALPPWRAFAPSLGFGLLSALCAVALMATSAYLITKASLIIHILLLGAPIALVRGFAIFRAVFRYADRLAGHDAAFRQLSRLRVGLLDRLIPLAPAGLGRTGRGNLLSSLVDDVDELQFLPLRVVQPLAVALTVAGLSLLGVALVSPVAAAALALSLLATLVIATLVQSALAGRADRQIAPLRAALADRILDTLGNLEVLRAYDALDGQLERVREADARLRGAQVRSAVGAGVVTGASTLFAGLACVTALLAGVEPVVRGELAPELLTLIVLVPLALFEVFAQVPQAVAAWRRVRTAAARVAATAPATVPPEIPVEKGSTFAQPGSLSDGFPHVDPLTTDDGVDLKLRGLAASWPGADAAISGIDLDLPAGSRLLVTGDSGAGKTTLANVLVRFLDYRGSYRIGGVEARTLDPGALRQTVGLVEQRPHLFHDTIRQNLLFARDTADDAELTEALQRVGLADWLRERGGLDAPVGERGALVSGGEAQRLALARGLLARFRVLVLDEPTANVDPGRAEQLLADLVAAAGTERTLVLISHTPIDPALITARLEL